MSARWEHQEPTAVPQAWQCGPDVRDPVEPESTLAATEGCEIAPAHPQAEPSQVKSSQVEPLIHNLSQFSIESLYMALSCLPRRHWQAHLSSVWPVVTNLSVACGRCAVAARRTWHRVHAMPWCSPLESMDNLRTRESKYSLSQQDWAPELGSDRTERRISG
jgi:hypothetical protein